MSDTVSFQTTPATPASGTVIATDEVQVGGTVANGHVQFVKLVDGTLNGTAPIPGSVDGLLVNLGANNDVTVTGTVTVGSHAVTNAGTFVVQENGAALTALQLLDDTVFAEDVASSAADKGVAILAVRRDADTSLVDTTGDYANLQVNNLGALKVEAFSGETLPVSLASVPSHAVTNAGTFAIQESGAALTALQLLDDTVFAEDVAAQAADKGIAILAVRRDADTSLVGTDNDYANLQVDALGRVKVEIFDGGDSHTVDGTVAVSSITTSVIPGTAATNLGKAIDSAAGSTDTGVATLAIRDDSLSALTPVEGDYVPLRVNSTGALHVTGGGGGTEFAVDSVAGGTDAGHLLLAVRDDATATLTPADGDYTQLRVNQRGGLWVDLETRLSSTQDSIQIGEGAVIADVLDLTNNNGLAVAILDGSGSQITSFGGGTQYTEDAAAAADPVGTAMMMVRRDTLSASEVSADGDNIAAKATSRGEQYVHVEPRAGSIAKTEDVASADADVGVPAMAIRRATPVNASGTDGDYEFLQMGSGRLWVSATIDNGIPAGTNNIGDVDVLTLPALPAGTNNIGDVDVLSIVPGTAATNLGKAEDAVHASGDTGVYAMGTRQDSPASTSGTSGDYQGAAFSAEGAEWVTPTPTTTGGLTIFRSLDLDETEEEVKATAGCVYGCWFTNTATATRWLKFYNATAANVTVGTTTPVITIGLPGNASDDISGALNNGGMGIGFSTAITVAATTGFADADTGAPAANDVIVNIFYK